MLSADRREAAFLAAGLLATAAQVLLLRELMVDAAGDEASIGLGLAAWFLGIALGARLVRQAELVPASPGPSSASALALLAVAAPLAIVAGRLLRRLLSPNAGELPGASLTLVIAGATLLPAGWLVGRLFTILATASNSGATGIARLYVLESVGSMAGGIGATLLALAGVPPFSQSAAFGSLGAALAVAPTRAHRVRVLAALAACLVTLGLAGRIDRWSEAARFAGIAGGLALRSAVDTPYQHLATGGDEVRHLYVSGQYAASFPDPYGAESLGHLLALMAPRPQRVLLLGGVERGIVPVLLRHPVRELVVVQPDRAALEFLIPQLADGDRRALADGRVRLVHDDPRHALWRETARFDLVLLLGADPTTLLRARLASVEFDRLVASRLEPDGVFVVSLPGAPTVLTGETEQLAGVLVRSLREAFPVVRATLANEPFAVAGSDAAAVTLAPDVLAARWRERALVSPSFDAAVLPVLLPPDRIAAQQAALDEAAARAPLGRDDRPVSLVHALARRQQLTADRSGRLIRSALAVPPAVLVGLALVASLAAIGRVRLAGGAAAVRRLASYTVALAGAVSLAWSLVLLFSFQTHAGALYGWLGALVALLMLGLALGGAWAARLDRARRRPAATADALLVLRRWMIGSTLLAFLLPLALAAAPASARAGRPAVFLLHAALLLAGGIATGGVFPLAAALRIDSGEAAGAAAARTEGADHLGAALAALTGAVLFVPVLGLRATLLLAALLLLLATIACECDEEPAGIH